ncbi:MAG: glycosyltransferase family 1 protein, partial [Chloroflexota bacterium]
MRIKIGMDSTSLLGQRTGVGNYTGRLLAALLTTDAESEYLLYSHRPLDGLEPELARATTATMHMRAGRVGRWLWMQTILPWIIRRTQPTLCHFTNEIAPVWRVKPSVITIHDASLFLHSRHHPPARLLSRLALVPIVAHQADAIITVSQSARNDLIRVLRLPPHKVHVVHEAAPANFRRVTNANDLAALRRKYSLPESFVLFVGTLEPRKNLRRLVRAFARVRRRGFAAHLIIVGHDGWLMRGFAREVERLGLQSVVRHIGYVPTADLPGLYSLATLFAFPSLYEGFGLPPLEAMACGAPVLCGDNSALAELYAGAAQLVDARDEAMIADSLACVLRDPERCAELSARGLARAENFSWQR